MKDILRIMVAQIIGLLWAVWVGHGVYHAFEPPKGVWWEMPLIITCVFGSIGTGVLIAFVVYRLAPGKNAVEEKGNG